MKLGDLLGKNVLIIDVETTGLPEKRSSSNSKDAYYPYNDVEKYRTSWIVQASWVYMEGFDNTKDYNELIKSIIRKPKYFSKIPTHKIHGITWQKASEEGTMLSKILNKDGLGDAIKNCDYILGHNILFDLNILRSECYRLNFKKKVEKLTDIIENDKFFCTSEYGKKVCKIKLPTRRHYMFKRPKLGELYKFYYKKKRTQSDIKTLLAILKKMEFPTV